MPPKEVTMSSDLDPRPALPAPASPTPASPATPESSAPDGTATPAAPSTTLPAVGPATEAAAPRQRRRPPPPVRDPGPQRWSRTCLKVDRILKDEDRPAYEALVADGRTTGLGALRWLRA